jgi:hypothetical protein
MGENPASFFTILAGRKAKSRKRVRNLPAFARDSPAGPASAAFQLDEEPEWGKLVNAWAFVGADMIIVVRFRLVEVSGLSDPHQM